MQGVGCSGITARRLICIRHRIGGVPDLDRPVRTDVIANIVRLDKCVIAVGVLRQIAIYVLSGVSPLRSLALVAASIANQDERYGGLRLDIRLTAKLLQVCSQ